LWDVAERVIQIEPLQVPHGVFRIFAVNDNRLPGPAQRLYGPQIGYSRRRRLMAGREIAGERGRVMGTRPKAVIGTAEARRARPHEPDITRAPQPQTPVNFEMPADACDCHTHIHGNQLQFPYFAGRKYTPGVAAPEEMAALHRALHVRRVVIVTPSVYGADNAATLYGMRARGADARGVAVISDDTSEAELDAMQAAGVRGIRMNLTTSHSNDPVLARQQFQAVVERVAPRGWHVQLYTNLTVIARLRGFVAVSPVPVVFDHFGGAQAELGLEQPGFRDLIALVRSGKAYVKISGAYRVSKRGPEFPDAAPLARALVEANAERVVWGSDWPHPNSNPGIPLSEVAPFYPIDDGLLLNQLPLWAPDAATRKAILVDNPARLYGF